MSLKKSLAIGKSVLTARLLGVRRPVVVKFKITNRCNGVCRYCLGKKNSVELSTSKVLDLVGQMAEAGTHKIGFFGGEALLREDMGEILDLCRQKSMYTTIITNGYLVPKKLNVVAKVDCLFISFDGPKRIHDLHRGAGSYDKVLAAIHAAKDCCKVVAHTTITKYNMNHIKEIAELARDAGIPTTYCPVYCNQSLLPSNQELKRIIMDLQKLKEEGYPVLTSHTILSYWLQWEDFAMPYSLIKRKQNPDCYAGKLFCEINSDGSIAPCDWSFRGSQSNVIKQGFRNAFLSLKSPACKACVRPWTAEYNFMFSLNPRTIWNYMKFVVKT
ncbi:MAG: radical SAM protein [Candidatus Woesearchaeota archaeon]